MIGCPGNTALNDMALFFLNGETMPFTHEDPLANCSSREEHPGTIGLMGALSREDPLLFSERPCLVCPLPLSHYTITHAYDRAVPFVQFLR
jgi:hypothetical protein